MKTSYIHKTQWNSKIIDFYVSLYHLLWNADQKWYKLNCQLAGLNAYLKRYFFFSYVFYQLFYQVLEWFFLNNKNLRWGKIDKISVYKENYIFSYVTELLKLQSELNYFRNTLGYLVWQLTVLLKFNMPGSPKSLIEM